MKVHSSWYVVVFLLSPVMGQRNSVINGEFTAGLRGWATFAGNGLGFVAPANSDVTGNGARNPSCLNYSGGAGISRISQSVQVVRGRKYAVRGDVSLRAAIAGSLNGGQVQMVIDTIVVDTVDFGVRVAAGHTRDRMSGEYLAPRSGLVSVAIEFSRQAPPTVAIAHLVDNVWMQETAGPIVTFDGRAKAGNQTFALVVRGEPGASAALFAGVGPGPAISIPGFTGALELTGPLVPLLVGQLDPSGSSRLPLPLSVNFLRRSASVQAVQTTATGNHIGMHYPIVVFSN